MNIPDNYRKVLNKGYVGLVSAMGDDLSVINAARVSYDKQSFPHEAGLTKRDKRLLKFLWEEGHTSPFRHATMTFEVYAPLMVARQHWKYVVASSHIDDQIGWNESSRRYITEEPSFYVPASFRSAPENSKQGSGEPLNKDKNNYWINMLNKHIELSEKLYDFMIKDGICAEQARLVLPAYGMYVRYRWTVSLHGVLNFLAQRLEHDAQIEIQEYAKAVKFYVKKSFPETYRVAFGDK